MKKDILETRINEFLVSDKTSEGKGLSKGFRDGLVKFTFDILNEEIKNFSNLIPIKDAIPEASASIISKFPFQLGREVFYVIFKNVKTQSTTSIKQDWGWKHTVLQGKTEEIQIRRDGSILYKVNGDWVLVDLIFNSRELALKKCNTLNQGVY